MFQGQFDLEDQGQRHQFSNSSRDLHVINTWFKFESKIQNNSQGITQTTPTMQMMTEPKTICLPLGGGLNIDNFLESKQLMLQLENIHTLKMELLSDHFCQVQTIYQL